MRKRAHSSLEAQVAPQLAGELVVWILNLYDIWTELLGRRFTYDVASWTGSHTAYRFCHDALVLLDLRCARREASTAIRWAMRNAPAFQRSRYADNN
jgi:hypothetical protein